MGDTISWMKRHIARKAEGELISTRELLCYGKRSTVDQSVGRLIEDEWIIRVARGLFVKTVGFDAAATPIPGLEEIVRAKAAAFKKRVVTSAKKIAREWGVEEDEESNARAERRLAASRLNPIVGPICHFSVTGCSSSFATVHGRAVLTQVADRKVALGDTFVGVTLRTMWHVGRAALATNDLMYERLAMFGRQDREEMRTRTDILPRWLSKRLGLEQVFSRPERSSDAKPSRRTSEFDPALRDRSVKIASAQSEKAKDASVMSNLFGIDLEEFEMDGEKVASVSAEALAYFKQQQTSEDEARDGPQK